MERKKTVILYDPENTGQIRSFSFSIKQLKVFSVLLTFFILLSLVVFTILINFSLERSSFLQWRSENKRLKSQIKAYEPLLSSLEEKTLSLESVQSKLLNIDAVASLDISHDTTTGADVKESFLGDIDEGIYKKNALTPVFSSLHSAIDMRIDNILRLSNFIEEQEFLLQSTPSGSPVSGMISSRFDFRYSPFNGKLVFHEGIDIAAPHGSPVLSSAKGIVIFAGYKTGYGFLVTVDHGYGFVTRYAHNSRVLVREGDYVRRGEKIALVGSTGHSTGPHVHYEVLLNGVPVNPIHFMFNTDTENNTAFKSSVTFVKSDF